MRPEAIKKLRGTFIAIAAASFLVVIAFMGTTTAISNMIAIRSQANATIDAIIDANGDLSSNDEYSGDGSSDEDSSRRSSPLIYSTEAMYGLRYFTVWFDKSGEIVDVDLSHVALIDTEAANALAKIASDPNTTTGLTQYDNYFCKERETDDGSILVFLDCSFQLENMSTVLSSTLLLSFIAFLVTLVTLFLLSKRAIAPEVERARAQQRFMTNASHELKTPIAVIRANTELTEMLSGETEWTRSTINQVDRLDELVRDLMTIVRGEERKAEEGALENLDMSAATTKAVDSFKGMLQQHDLVLTTAIDDGVTLRASEASIEQLVCLLVDNAIKYCDPGGTINVRLASGIIGHGCTLAISNDFAAGADVDYRRFFDRFYRADESHENQQGYGIGLSVAESICKSYHGSIKATWKAGVITFTCVLKDK